MGFIAFLVMAATVMRRGAREYFSSQTLMGAAITFGVAIGVMSVMAHGTVDYLFHNSPQFAALFFLLLALLRAEENRRDADAQATTQA
jgi:hypothetical protein